MFVHIAREATTEGVIPPPEGVTPDFDNPAYIGNRIIIPVVVGACISTLFLIMRLYTKAIIMSKFGPEDVVMSIAWVLAIAVDAGELVSTKYGYGKHLWEVRMSDFSPHYLQILLAMVIIYVPAMTLSKVAILLFYHRVAPQRWFRMAIWVTMGVTVAYSIALMFSLFFACDPVAKGWDLSIERGSCINRPAVYMANGALNVITDFAILLLPIPILWRLQVPTRQKIGLGLMFSVGSLTCIISVVRLQTLKPLLESEDQTWDVVKPSIWVVAEVNLAIVCGCLSAIKPFLRCHAPRLIGYKPPTTKGTGNSESTTGTREPPFASNDYRNPATFKHQGWWGRSNRQPTLDTKDDDTTELNDVAGTRSYAQFDQRNGTLDPRNTTDSVEYSDEGMKEQTEYDNGDAEAGRIMKTVGFHVR